MSEIIKTSGTGLFPRREHTFMNRTGGALTVGGVYAVDNLCSDGASTTYELGLNNLIACATGNLSGFLVVALEAAADDQPARCLIEGVEQIMVDGNGTDATVGLKLIAANASTSLFPQSTSALIPAVGRVLEANTGTAALKLTYFKGDANWVGSITEAHSH